MAKEKDVKYGDMRAISLSISDMLSLSLALADAIRYNKHNGYPNWAGEIEQMEERIEDQIRPWIDRASQYADRELARLRAEREAND